MLNRTLSRAKIQIVGYGNGWRGKTDFCGLVKGTRAGVSRSRKRRCLSPGVKKKRPPPDNMTSSYRRLLADRNNSRAVLYLAAINPRAFSCMTIVLSDRRRASAYFHNVSSLSSTPRIFAFASLHLLCSRMATTAKISAKTAVIIPIHSFHTSSPDARSPNPAILPMKHRTERTTHTFSSVVYTTHSPANTCRTTAVIYIEYARTM